MSVNEILTEVRRLSPAERKQLLEALSRDEEAGQTLSVDERRAELHERLLAEGLLKHIPPRRAVPRDFEPVPIEGKPLSETIIEERRYIYPTVPLPVSALDGLIGIMPPVGGDALADTEALYDDV